MSLLAPVKAKLKNVVDRVSGYVRDNNARDIHLALQRRALEETSLFVEERMYTTPSFKSKYDLLAAAMEGIQVKGGLCCEFGVFSGETIRFIARHFKGPVYGFDSFEGLPEDWRPGVEKGHFKMAALPKVPANVELIKGWFNETLPGFIARHPGPASFLHIDCDLYSSSKTVFRAAGGSHPARHRAEFR